MTEGARPSGVPIGWLAAALLALAAIGNLLLPAFLGFAPWADTLLVLVGCGAIILTVVLAERGGECVPLRTILIGFALALGLLILGGEGRFLYAPADWQVRDAVLADLARHRWPFAYAMPGGPQILRAPLGMYLLPSLAGPEALDAALLASNAAMLGLLLSLGSTLFPAGRPRKIALTVFLLFSGWDAIGTLLMRAMGQDASFYHLENWAYGLQYSATLTQLFWAPQHAIAGWACALLFLLRQQGRLRIGTVAAAIPLLAFWSPLAAAGAVPFLLYAGIVNLRRLRPLDFALPVLAVAIAAAALVYQHAGAAKVGAGPSPVGAVPHLLSLLLEAAPLALPALLFPTRFGRAPAWIATAMLVATPFWQIGTWADFQMRVTIVPLCVLATINAELLVTAGPRLRRFLIASLAIGSLTTLSELFPILTMRAAPPPLCSLPSAWDQQTGLRAPKTTYLAPLSALPVKPAEVVDPRRDPRLCWSRAWITPAWIG